MIRLNAAAALPILLVPLFASAAEMPEEIAAPDHVATFTAQAHGALVYECRSAPSNVLNWQLREPVATLIKDGKTVGVHRVGLAWEMSDSIIVGKETARAPAPDPHNIPWLKIDITTEADDEPLQDVTVVQRVNTVGGVLEGSCEKVGELRPVLYSADYVFLKKEG
jgi:hypothetical protein